MGANTAIQWCHHTLNPWRGCSKVHAGCTNCYAEREAVRFPKVRGIWGVAGTRVKASDAMWKEPLKWDRDAAKAGERRRVFCASLADVFEDWRGPVLNHLGVRVCYCDKPGCGLMGGEEPMTGCPQCGNAGARWATMDDLRRDLFTLIDKTSNLDWLLLTKRPENIGRMWPRVLDAAGPNGQLENICEPRSNVWLGTSISDQATADEWIPRLLKCRELSPVLFVSAEPLLGPINLRSDAIRKACGSNCDQLGYPLLDWAIVGGESCHNARRMEVEWAIQFVEQLESAAIPAFFKQLGSCPVIWDPIADGLGGVTGGGGTVPYITEHPKGGDIEEFPEALRVREFPSVQAV